MGHEWEGNVVGDDVSGTWAAVQEWAQDLGLTVISDDGYELSATFNVPVNPRWPEDLHVAWNPSTSRLYVLFHTGRGPKEQGLLLALQDGLRADGLEVVLEEL